MADIEERAEAWVKENYPGEHRVLADSELDQALIDAYLAGAGQAAADYSAVFSYRGQR